jgi:acetyl-CoA C-acetyltransferase
MMQFDPLAPVLVGVGEAGGAAATQATSPTRLAGLAIRNALQDCGQPASMAGMIDCIAATRTFEDSGVMMGTGSPDNVPHAYALAGGLRPQHFVYADVGGQSPQALVNEFAGLIRRGEHRAVVIAGAEAMATAKSARNRGEAVDWRQPSVVPFEDRRTDFPILSRAEIRHGIISMPLAYSLMETARRSRLGLGQEHYARAAAQLWSAFSQKSLSRIHAAFPRHWSADELTANDHGNYRLTNAYRRWHVAQDGADLGGALILTSAGAALDIGIDPAKMVWLAGAAEASDPPLSERMNLSSSDAQVFAVNAALDQAQIAAGDLGPVDIYSCFPCAVFAATDTMELPGRKPGDYSLTGGLTFFGGPGNGYSLNAIAAMVQALRADGSKPGLIIANGGVMSKQAAGVYCAQQPAYAWAGETAGGYHAARVPVATAPGGTGRIITFAFSVKKDRAGDAILLLQMENGDRALAVMAAGAFDPHAELLGQSVTITAGEKRNVATLA